MSTADTALQTIKRLSRRRALLVSGGAIAAAGAAAAIFRAPRRADGLPAGVDPARARALGDGFFVVDGWVLTAEDLAAIKASAPEALP